MGDPFFDLGNFAVNHELTPDEDEELLADYDGGPIRPDRLARLTLMRTVSDFREAMWGVLQQGISTLDVDFVAYAGEHFDRLLAGVDDAGLRAGAARGRRGLTPRSRIPVMPRRWHAADASAHGSACRRESGARRSSPSRRRAGAGGRIAALWARAPLVCPLGRAARRSHSSERWSCSLGLVARVPRHSRRRAVSRPRAAPSAPPAAASQPVGSGSAAATLPPLSTPTPIPSVSGDPVLVGAGDIASCGFDGDDATARLLDGIAGTVFTAGDNAYDNGSADDFARVLRADAGAATSDRTRPAAGNHDWNTEDAQGYRDYFGPSAVNDDGDTLVLVRPR